LESPARDGGWTGAAFVAAQIAAIEASSKITDNGWKSVFIFSVHSIGEVSQ
jgi:hypothetical protein